MSSIYLAGKIRPACWRTQLVEKIEDVLWEGESWPIEWEPLRNSINLLSGKYDYCGPFYMSCNHGCGFREDSHGLDKVCSGSSYTPRATRLCKKAIDAADYVFAWIDEADCYGTIAEIGYAAAKGKPICIAGPRRYSDMWFVYELAENTAFGNMLTPRNSLNAWFEYRLEHQRWNGE